MKRSIAFLLLCLGCASQSNHQEFGPDVIAPMTHKEHELKKFDVSDVINDVLADMKKSLDRVRANCNGWSAVECRMALIAHLATLQAFSDFGYEVIPDTDKRFVDDLHRDLLRSMHESDKSAK